MSGYTVTVKFAKAGTTYINPENGEISTSAAGHVWLEAREPGKSLKEPPTFSSGWSMGNSKTQAGTNNLSRTDWADYREDKRHPINSLTMNITKEQFEKLKEFPDLAATGKIAGFQTAKSSSNNIVGSISIPRNTPRNNDAHYNAFTNSCIDYAGQGLAHIRLAGKNFDGDGLSMPDRQIKTFLEEMANHNKSGISVRFEGKTHTLKPGENVQQFWDKVAPNWDYVPYYMQNQNPDMPKTQYAQNALNPALQPEAAKESSPFLAFAEKNKVTPEETRQFLSEVQDYGNQLKEQEMQLAAERQNQSRGMSISL